MAKNYRNSDYALNKYSTGIVYRFADRIVEVTLQDYLADNPEKIEQDFLELKTLSDKIYHQQVVDDSRTSRLDISIVGLEDIIVSADIPLDERLIEIHDQRLASEALTRALESGILTDVQLRRFRLYFIGGKSHREIAEIEGVTHHAVSLSLDYALKKLKKLFN